MEFSCDDYSRKKDIELGTDFWKKILACLPFASQKIFFIQIHSNLKSVRQLISEIDLLNDIYLFIQLKALKV